MSERPITPLQCLRTTGRHVGHMAAVDVECRDVQDADEIPTVEADDIVHYWPAADGSGTDKQYGDLSACGVDITKTPYTFGSPVWSEVTCPACLTKQPAPTTEACGATGPKRPFCELPTRHDETHETGGEQPQAGDTVEWLGVEPVVGVVTDVEPGDVSIRWRNTETRKPGFDHPKLNEFAGSWRVIETAEQTAARLDAEFDAHPLVQQVRTEHATSRRPWHYGDGSPMLGIKPDDRFSLTELGERVAVKSMAAQVIADARDTEGASTGKSLPPAPDGLADDEAWAAYCALLPKPTDDEKAAVLIEFGNPYAALMDSCREQFRANARRIWELRSRDALRPESYKVLRGNMASYRACLDIYRKLTEDWARRTLTDNA